MAEKTKSLAAVVSQEKIATDIYSLILATPAAQKAVAGQFVSVYCKDRTKLLPRPISICEINREAETLRLVYRLTGKGNGHGGIFPAGRRETGGGFLDRWGMDFP